MKFRKEIQFTLIELLIVVSIISILAALLLPGLKMARDKSQEISCANKQKQIGLTFVYYTSDYNQLYPNCNWSIALCDDYLNGDIYNRLGKCPSAKDKTSGGGKIYRSYSYPGVYFNDLRIGFASGFDANYQVKRPQIRLPSTKCLIMEYWNDADTTERTWGNTKRLNNQNTISLHNGASNFLFSDNHVERLRIWGGEINGISTGWSQSGPAPGPNMYSIWRPKENKNWR